MSGHTPGPWEWFDDSLGHVRLQTPDRGRLIVMDFVRKGMRGATPRFAIMDDDQPRGRRGGIMREIYPWKHPDGRLIAAAPDLLEACRAIAQFHDDCFVTGRPLAIDGRTIDHTLLNKAGNLAKAAIARAEGRS